MSEANAEGFPRDSEPRPDVIAVAKQITSDLTRPNPLIYWVDLLLCVVIGYGGFVLAALSANAAAVALGFAIACLAIYRGVVFIHELVHMNSSQVPGFKIAWNILIGVPFLIPSFLYEGVHQLHHSKAHYGTLRDPEYLPLASRPRSYVLWYLIASLFLPILLLIRFAILSPLAFAIPPLRRFVIERYSSIVINPAFRRERPPYNRRQWITLEIVTTLFTWGFLARAVSLDFAGRGFWLALSLASVVSFLDRARTLVAHHWEKDGDIDGRTADPVAQLLDTVNYPHPAVSPAFWAPVGMRYHALHHLLPNLPYHNLPAAHRRLVTMLPGSSKYAASGATSPLQVFRKLIRADAQIGLRV